MRRRIASLLLVVGVVAVAASDTRAAAAEAIAFETADGFVLHADLWRAADAKAPVAILLHQFNEDRRSWAPLAPALVREGFTVLALDQRGQGESTEQKTPEGVRALRVRELPRGDVGVIVRAGTADVAAALRALAGRGLSTDRVVLVGASYGCTVALLAAHETPGVSALVLLSPGTRYFGVDVVESASRFPGPLLAIAAEDDPDSAASARELDRARGGRDEPRVLATGGHGTALLSARPGLAQEIAAFLARPAGLPGGAGVR